VSDDDFVIADEDFLDEKMHDALGHVLNTIELRGWPAA
jgi:hypothetical protein